MAYQQTSLIDLSLLEVVFLFLVIHLTRISYAQVAPDGGGGGMGDCQCPPRPCNETIYLILFAVTLAAFIASLVAHIILYIRRRGKKADDKGNYVIPELSTKSSDGATSTDVYEDPVPTLTRTTSDEDASYTTLDTTMKSSPSSNAYKGLTIMGTRGSIQDKRKAFDSDATVPQDKLKECEGMTSVQDKRRTFELGATTTGATDIRVELDHPSLKRQADTDVSEMNGDDDADDTASVDTAPEDIAPHPYEKITYKKKKKADCCVM